MQTPDDGILFQFGDLEIPITNENISILSEVNTDTNVNPFASKPVMKKYKNYFTNSLDKLKSEMLKLQIDEINRKLDKKVEELKEKLLEHKNIQDIAEAEASLETILTNVSSSNVITSLIQLVPSYQTKEEWSKGIISISDNSNPSKKVEITKAMSSDLNEENKTTTLTFRWENDFSNLEEMNDHFISKSINISFNNRIN